MSTRKVRIVRRKPRADGPVALVDVEIILQQVCHELLEERVIDDEAVYHLDMADVKTSMKTRLRQVQRELGAGSLVLAVGSKSNWRKHLDVGYKADRPRKPLGYFAAVDWLLKEFDVRSVPWLEADDVIGILATGELKDRCVVVSTDKDMRTIPCRLYNPSKPGDPHGELIDVASADLNHLVLALSGDPTDGYKGARGVGGVTARRALEGLKPPDRPARAVQLFLEAGHDEEYAILQLRLARVLRHGEYDGKTGELTLWTPPTAAAHGRACGAEVRPREGARALEAKPGRFDGTGNLFDQLAGSVILLNAGPSS